jgi:hypothetical protein
MMKRETTAAGRRARAWWGGAYEREGARENGCCTLTLHFLCHLEGAAINEVDIRILGWTHFFYYSVPLHPF